MPENKETDPTKSAYWEGATITIPPWNKFDEGAFNDKEEYEDYLKFASRAGQKAVITSAISMEETEYEYWNFAFPDGYIYHGCNFGTWLPIEMALKLGHAGLDHFAKKLPLYFHPHYKDHDKE